MMSRLVVSTAAVLALACVSLVGCSNEGADAADELGVQKGRRPVPAEQQKPPGPPDGKLVTEEEASEEPADDQD
jgi:hypothetical protein